MSKGCAATGCLAYLTKPFLVQELIEPLNLASTPTAETRTSEAATRKAP